MRLWSLHPSALDRQGLVAGWREGLLAQAVLVGSTRGYRAHPQVRRFREQADPLGMIGAYLEGLGEEARRRGYRFDAARIAAPPARAIQAEMPVTRGQLEWEWRHLSGKLRSRSPDDYTRLIEGRPRPHPLFFVVEGQVEPWEVAAHRQR